MRYLTRIGSLWKLLAAAGLLIVWGYSGPPGPLYAAPEDRSTEYVDARVCAACHRQIADDYLQTGMGRSFFRPSAANTMEDYSRRHEFYHALSDTYYSMIQRDGEFYQRRWQIGFGGAQVNEEEMKVDYVLGSGNHARSYLHRTSAGTLIELPLGWYPEAKSSSATGDPEGPAAGRWAMSPGSDSPRPRTRRFVAYRCMYCHNAIPRIPAGHDAPGSDPVFLGDLPEGIDCQRCHGPGGKHVRTAGSAGARVADVRASIVNPARLSPGSQMEVCMQCHLETTSGRIPAAIQRFDRGPFSFVPGEPLESFVISFDHAKGTGHDDKFEAVSSVYRLRQSRCFVESAGKLMCQTCHDPHRALRGGDAAKHYSAICLQCHATRQGSIEALDSLVASKRHTSAANCADCHMPKRRAEDTPGMVMTDHLIQRRPPTGDLLAPMSEPLAVEYRGAVAPYYPSPLPLTGENALYLAVAQVGLGNNVEAGLPELVRELEKQKPREAEFYMVLGDAWRSAGNKTEAVAAYRQAVRLSPNSLRAMRALGVALHEAGDAAQAAESFRKALQLAPSDPGTWYRYGMLDASSGRTKEAIERIQKAIALDPSLPEKSRTLAGILAAAGQTDRAQAVLRDALRIDPFDEDAWDLAGRILSGKGETAEAMYDFERAIRLRPGSAPHLYDYALALARANRLDEARERAEAAVRADGDFAEAHELLGGLFERKRQLPEAEREYRRALEIRPNFSSAHLRLGSVLAAQGNVAQAAEHLREAARAGDPAIAQQAAKALQQLGTR